MAHKSRVLVTVNEEIMRELQARATETGNPVTSILREAIYMYLRDLRAAREPRRAGDGKNEAPVPGPGAMAPPPGDRRRELEWRRTHAGLLKRYAGQWVVVEGEELVAHGKEATAVADRARKKGVVVPYLFRVEPEYGDDVARFGL